jgi:hypothetical protein
MKSTTLYHRRTRALAGSHELRELRRAFRMLTRARAMFTRIEEQHPRRCRCAVCKCVRDLGCGFGDLWDMVRGINVTLWSLESMVQCEFLWLDD